MTAWRPLRSVLAGSAALAEPARSLGLAKSQEKHMARYTHVWVWGLNLKGFFLS